MADVANKINFLESENKLLMDQQQNYKELCKVLTQRHVEILKYLSHLRNLVEKIMSLSKENVVYANYHTDKSAYESNIIKYDKQIQFLTESIQSSHTRISGMINKVNFLISFSFYFPTQIMKEICSKNI